MRILIAAGVEPRCRVASRKNAQQILLIGPPVSFEPTCFVLSLRVVVSPVDHPTFRIPHVLAVESYSIACLQFRDPRREVDVVHDKDGLTRSEPHDESLMPAAGEIVREYARHYPFSFNLDIARPVFECAPDSGVVSNRRLVACRVATG